MEDKKYYKHLDIMRIIFCIAILFYHLGLLKGGYLAVCSFFALSGYLSCTSAFKKEKLSLKDYYINRFKRVYFPLIIVVFITIPLVLLIKDFNWINLKPETTSVLLGYNNFWQLSANLDYFARHVNSPFMHFWYVSILLQFDLIFPFIHILLKKTDKEINKFLPIIVCTTLGIISYILFCLNGNIMSAYYNTFTRIFSIFFGLTLGYIHCNYKPLILPLLKKKPFEHIIFYTYTLMLIILFFTISADSKFYKIIMLLATFITLRQIDYSMVMIKNKVSIKNNIIKMIASISYEVYLVQYPVIFLFQFTNLNNILKIILTIIVTIIVSIILHYAFSKTDKKKLPRGIIAICLIGFAMFGAFKYVTAENHTEEMKELENLLAENEEEMKKKQEEYEKKFKEEQENLNKLLEEYTVDDTKITEIISNLNVVGVGDSVLLGAEKALYNVFPKGYFDGKLNRTGYVINSLLQELNQKNLLGDVVVINVGANGDCNTKAKDEIMKTLGSEREVFWLTVTNDSSVNVNAKLKKYAENYPNLHIIDWEEISKGHSEYFYADGIHLTGSGQKVYAETVYNAIYDAYSKKLNSKRDELLKAREEELKTRITIFGNDLVINLSNKLELPSEKTLYLTSKDYTVNNIKEKIKDTIKEEKLNYKVLLAFDNNIELKEKDYKEIINLINSQKEHKIYIIATSNDEYKILEKLSKDTENIIIYNFNEVIENNDDYLMIDKVHYTDKANDDLSSWINNIYKDIEE